MKLLIEETELSLCFIEENEEIGRGEVIVTCDMDTSCMGLSCDDHVIAIVLILLYLANDTLIQG